MHGIKIFELPPTLGVKELAQLLHLSEKTVRSDLSRSPDALPPPIRRRQGEQRTNLVWLTGEVLEWLKDRTSHRKSPAPPKRGAPTKAERVRRLQKTGGQQ